MLGVFFPGQTLQPSLMFVGKARSLRYSGPPEWCFTLVGSGLKIRLGCKGLPGTNTLAYYENP